MRLALLLLLFLCAQPELALAVQPDEVLSDSLLELRARAISRDLRCPVCQGENIDDSDAPISRDLRLLVRERLLAGDTDSDVIDFIVARYGEFVLFRPNPAGVNLILWGAGPGLFLVGAAVSLTYTRRRARLARQGVESVPLTSVEEARLRAILAQYSTPSPMGAPAVPNPSQGFHKRH